MNEPADSPGECSHWADRGEFDPQNPPAAPYAAANAGIGDDDGDSDGAQSSRPDSAVGPCRTAGEDDEVEVDVDPLPDPLPPHYPQEGAPALRTDPPASPDDALPPPPTPPSPPAKKKQGWQGGNLPNQQKGFLEYQLKRWWEDFERLRSFFNEHGHTDVRLSDPANELTLWSWTSKQRHHYRIYRGLAKGETHFTPDKVAALESIGFDFKITAACSKEEEWRRMYDALVEYKNEHGDCNVGTSDCNVGTDQGDNGKTEEEMKLVRWVSQQRSDVRKWNDEKKKRKKKGEGSSSASGREKTDVTTTTAAGGGDGDDNSNGADGGKKKKGRRGRKKTPSEDRDRTMSERVRLLDAIDFTWDKHEAAFLSNLRRYQEHVQRHGCVGKLSSGRGVKRHPLYAFVDHHRSAFRDVLKGKDNRRLNLRKLALLVEAGFEFYSLREVKEGLDPASQLRMSVGTQTTEDDAPSATAVGVQTDPPQAVVETVSVEMQTRMADPSVLPPPSSTSSNGTRTEPRPSPSRKGAAKKKKSTASASVSTAAAAAAAPSGGETTGRKKPRTLQRKRQKAKTKKPGEDASIASARGSVERGEASSEAETSSSATGGSASSALGVGEAKKKKKKEGSCSYGRWTAEEHVLFLAGVKRHGKAYDKIAPLIESRTVGQVRSHGQTHFRELAKAPPPNRRGSGQKEGVVAEAATASEGPGGGGVGVGGASGAAGEKHLRRVPTTPPGEETVAIVSGSKADDDRGETTMTIGDEKTTTSEKKKAAGTADTTPTRKGRTRGGGSSSDGSSKKKKAPPRTPAALTRKALTTTAPRAASSPRKKAGGARKPLAKRKRADGTAKPLAKRRKADESAESSDDDSPDGGDDGAAESSRDKSAAGILGRLGCAAPNDPGRLAPSGGGNGREGASAGGGGSEAGASKSAVARVPPLEFGARRTRSGREC